MQAMTDLQPAWHRRPIPSFRRLSPPEQPADLHIRALDRHEQLVLVRFSLGRLAALTRAELEVARWAHAGHSNGVIARERKTSIATVSRQMHAIIQKLGTHARLHLATIPELSAWSPPTLAIGPSFSVPKGSVPSGNSRELDPRTMAHVWREIASGFWGTLAGVDAGGLRHAVMSRNSAKSVDWTLLSEVQRDVLALVAAGFAQKAIAMKLGLTAPTVSAALDSGRRRLGFGSIIELVRAYCAYRDVID
jgi:DNA-binding NarL/FixJ family response regulator